MPQVHDEFSYLLAADTFSQGRLTNPPHPLWEFFETIHVVQQPTYMSMYPLMQGAALALGKTLFGHPWWGVLLSMGAMFGAACWMLQAFVPPVWAFAGALLIGMQFGTNHYWMNSYWGGAVAATGGCLVLGAWGRLRRVRHISGRASLLGAVLGLGVGILANSRPWEGLLLCIPVGAAFLWWIVFADASARRTRLVRVAAPCAAVLLLTAAFMMYNNWRVTGDVLKLPYALNRETYAVAPIFPWENTRPKPHYRHAVIEKFYLEWEPTFQGADTFLTFSGWLLPSLLKVEEIVDLAGGPVFAVPMVLFLVPLWRAPRLQFLLVTAAVFCLGLLLPRYVLPHYLAPALGVMTAIKVAALRRLFYFRVRGRSFGIFIAPLVVIAGAALNLGDQGIIVPDCMQENRPRLVERLENLPGRHLVVVQYLSQHNIHCEWVYNEASVDEAKIIWAREMSPDRNRSLFEYYGDRHIWLLEADAEPPELRPLSNVRSRPGDSGQGSR